MSTTNLNGDPTHPFLYDLLRTPSPTGREQPLQHKVYDYMKDVAHEIEPDSHGNLVLTLNPKATRKVMLAGHCDQIGYLIKYISPSGYLYLDPLGGTDSGVLPGERLTIHTEAGPLTGVVGRKMMGFQSQNEIQQIPSKNQLWVDIGASNEDDAKSKVKVGDYATFPLQPVNLLNGLLTSPGLDNKAGLYVCLQTMRRCAELHCDIRLDVVSTVQEEIGSRGAVTAGNRLHPDVGIAVDVTPATDDPGFDLPPQSHIPCKLRAGPTLSTGPNTNPMVEKLLLDAARNNNLPSQSDPSGETAANDARVIQTTDGGVAAASVGIPIRNMHSQVEIISLADLDTAISLLTAFLQSITPQTDFRPFNFGPT